MIRLGDKLLDILQSLRRRGRAASEMTDLLVERRVIAHLAHLSSYNFDAAVRRGKVALLAAALGLNSRALIKQVRMAREDLDLADVARF